MRSENNRYTQDCIKSQIRSDNSRRQAEWDYQHLYHKPHFGPEQTDKSLLADHHRYTSNKNFVNRSLQTQMSKNRKMRSMSNFLERSGDLENLKVAWDTFVFE